MPRSPGIRPAALLAMAVAACLAGCVYLRLLAFKQQLTRFDENFVVQPGEDFALRCLHPVLTGEDLRWLGAEPRDIRPWHDGREWSVRWIKVPPAGVSETSVYDMEFLARLSGGRLVEAVIPRRYFAYFPKELFLNLLRSTGSATVNRGNKQAEAQTKTPPEITLPNLKSIHAMLGAPTQKLEGPDRVTYFYSYRLDLLHPTTPPVEITFVFDAASGSLRKLVARLPHGTLKYDFAAPRS